LKVFFLKKPKTTNSENSNGNKINQPKSYLPIKIKNTDETIRKHFGAFCAQAASS
jgi:hypothetical protein